MTLAVAPRNGVGEGQVREALAGLAGDARVRFFDMPTIEVSSSTVRDRIAAGRAFEFLLPERVAHRITEACLYRGVAA